MKRGRGKTDLKVFPSAQGGALPNLPFVALVHGADTPLLPLDLPPKLTGQAREQVASHHLFDAVGLNIDQAELRPFSDKPHGSLWSRAIVTHPEQVSAWRQRFKTPESRCLAVLPDYLGLPAAADTWVVSSEQDHICARLGLEDGFSAEPELAAVMLSKATAPKAVLRLGPQNDVIDAVLKARDLTVYQDVSAFQKAGLPIPQSFAHNELAFDLTLSPRAAFDQLSTTLRAWRMPVGLAILALALWSTSTLLSTNTLKTQALSTRSQTVATVRDVFVTTGPILDIRTQVSQALSARQARIGNNDQDLRPLDLFKSSALVINNSAATLITTTYFPRSGLQASLRLPDFASLDQLAAALEAAQIAVDILQSSSIDSGEVEAQLALQFRERTR